MGRVSKPAAPKAGSTRVRKQYLLKMTSARPGHTANAPDGKLYRCAHVKSDGTRCRYCTKDKYEIVRHAHADHPGATTDKAWKDGIDPVDEDEGVALRIKYVQEKKYEREKKRTQDWMQGVAQALTSMGWYDE